MKFWIVAVEDPNAFPQVTLDNATFHTSSVKDGILLVFNERDVPLAGKILANRHPGYDVHVLEQTEAYYVKPSAPIRKIWDKNTGNLQVP